MSSPQEIPKLEIIASKTQSKDSNLEKDASPIVCETNPVEVTKPVEVKPVNKPAEPKVETKPVEVKTLVKIVEVNVEPEVKPVTKIGRAHV